MTTLEPQLEKPISRRRRGLVALAQFACWFAAVVALKWTVLYEPPVWDAAFSVYPGAITLNENGFDLWDLLHRPIYMQGGPNCHSLSLLTWTTAAVMYVVGFGPRLWLTLHLIHMAITAVAMTALFRFARPLLGARLAVAACATVLLFPLFQTQAGSIYLDMPVATCTFLALANWTGGRKNAGIAWSVLAATIKLTGLVTIGTLALATLAEERPWREKIIRSAIILGCGTLTFLPSLVVLVPYTAASNSTSLLHYIDYNWMFRLVQVPDLCLMFFVFLAVSLPWLKSVFARLLRQWVPEFQYHVPAAPADPRRDILFLMPWVFLVFFLSFPFVGMEMYVLPRYYILIVPLMVVGLAAVVLQRFGARAAYGLLLVMAALFVVNRRGDFYPAEELNDFSITERSAEYQDLQAAQMDGVRALATLDPTVPVFYGLPEHYFLSYPQTGYVNAAHPQGHCLYFEEPYRNAKLADFPRHFYLLNDFYWLGGEKIRALVEQVATSQDLESHVVSTFCHGNYKTELIEVRESRAAARPVEASDRR